MSSTLIRNMTGAVFVSVAAPALMFIGGGVAQAVQASDNAPQAHSMTTITERPGHVAIETHPYPVTPPMVWGPFPDVASLLDD